MVPSQGDIPVCYGWGGNDQLSGCGATAGCHCSYGGGKEG